MPTYPISIQGLADGQLVLRQGLLFDSRFFLSGKYLKAKRGMVEVPVGADTVKVRIAGSSWAFYREPAVMVGDEKRVLAAKLPTPLFVLSLLPMLLLLGGAIGGAFACLACMANAAIVRAPWSAGVRVTAVMGVMSAAVALYSFVLLNVLVS